MLLLALCVIFLCQKVRLGFMNVRSVRTLAAFNITESIGITLTAGESCIGPPEHHTKPCIDTPLIIRTTYLIPNTLQVAVDLCIFFKFPRPRIDIIFKTLGIEVEFKKTRYCDLGLVWRFWILNSGF
jgi:hypothetical protein